MSTTEDERLLKKKRKLEALQLEIEGLEAKRARPAGMFSPRGVRTYS